MILMSAITSFLSTTPSLADIVLAFTAASTSGSLAPDTTGAGVTGVDLSRSAGIAYEAGSNSYRSTGFTTSNSRNSGDYLEWGFTSTIPYDLTNLELAFARESVFFDIGRGPRDVEIDASVNGGAFTMVGVLNNFGAGTQVLSPIDLSVYTNVTQATFRIYPHDSTSTSNYFEFVNSASLGNRSIVVNGVAVPEPSAFLFGLLVCGVLSTGSYVRHRFGGNSTDGVPAA
jgi:hypothetical protein